MTGFVSLKGLLDAFLHCLPAFVQRTQFGTCFRGGTDSSTVVEMMERRKRRPVKTFLSVFQEQLFNELEYADIAVQEFNVRHYQYLVRPSDCFEASPYKVRCFDQPFGNYSAIPTYFCARPPPKKGVKILLAGRRRKGIIERG